MGRPKSSSPAAARTNGRSRSRSASRAEKPAARSPRSSAASARKTKARSPSAPRQRRGAKVAPKQEEQAGAPGPREHQGEEKDTAAAKKDDAHAKKHHDAPAQLGASGFSFGLFSEVVVSLSVSGAISLVPGVTMSAFQDMLMVVPGLLALMPALVGLRGNIFGSLAAKLSTTVQELSVADAMRLEKLHPHRLGGHGHHPLADLARDLGARYCMARGEMLLLSLLLPLLLVLNPLASPSPNLDVGNLALVSALSGLLSAYLMLTASRQLVFRSYQRGTNPDNVAAPFVTTIGDMVTVPIVLGATLFNTALPNQAARNGLLAVFVALAAVEYRRAASLCHGNEFRELVLERLPVLTVCLTISFTAGLALDRMVDGLTSGDATTASVLLALSPVFNALGGSGGGLFASRVSTFAARALQKEPEKKFPLPLARPPRVVVLEAAVLALSVCTVMAVIGAYLVFGHAAMGVLRAFRLSAGLAATISSAAVLAYVVTAVCYHLHLDADNFGVPVNTATMDLLCSLSFMLLALM